MNMWKIMSGDVFCYFNVLVCGLYWLMVVMILVMLFIGVGMMMLLYYWIWLIDLYWLLGIVIFVLVLLCVVNWLCSWLLVLL